jgi:hypothetical protein
MDIPVVCGVPTKTSFISSSSTVLRTSATNSYTEGKTGKMANLSIS